MSQRHICCSRSAYTGRLHQFWETWAALGASPMVTRIPREGYTLPFRIWLVRARSHQTFLEHVQTLVSLCQELGWIVNSEKSELDPKQVFDFIGFQFDFKEGKVKSTHGALADLTLKKSRICSPHQPAWSDI